MGLFILPHDMIILDISSLGAVKKVLPESCTYGAISLTIAVMMVTTGFVRPLPVKKTSTLPQSICKVLQGQSTCSEYACKS